METSVISIKVVYPEAWLKNLPELTAEDMELVKRRAHINVKDEDLSLETISFHY